MTRPLEPAYEFDSGLSLDPIEAGTNLLVTGVSAGGREVALQLALGAASADEGLLLVAADRTGRALLDRCLSLQPTLDLFRVAIVDCSGERSDPQRRFERSEELIAGPGDLAAIGIHLSTLYEAVTDSEMIPVRIGVFSVTSILEHARYRDVSRLFHMLTGRVIATGDLSVSLLDPAAVDDSTVESMLPFFDGRVLVREANGGGFDYRYRPTADDATEWQSLELETT
jgi:hypothetical protein